MTPLERAVAAAEIELLGHVDPTSTNLSDHGLARNVVRAVLTAIREPSDAMVDAAYRKEGVGPDAVDVPFSLTPDDTWQAMIDAALADGE